MLSILDAYLARRYLINLIWVLILIGSLIILFDLVEQIRVFSGKGLPFKKILLLSVYRMFYLIQKTNAYAVLLAGIVTYMKLTSSAELIAARAAGVSTIGLLRPAVIVALLFGILMTTILNPLSAHMISEYERMETNFKKGGVSSLSLSKTGLWIKDNLDDGDERIIHALKLSQSLEELYEVTFYSINNGATFAKRYDIEKAALKNGMWETTNVHEYDHFNHDTFHAHLTFPTNINFHQIQESMLMPETISFWRLPAFISIAEDSGFAATKHKIYFYKLLLQPLYFAAMVILGIAFTLVMPRFGKIGKYLIAGLLIGFLLNFLEYFVLALGSSGKIPIFLTAISPTLITLMLGSYLHLHLAHSR